ncbi:MAG: hypothetical protein K2R98_19670 [Gemmataceae bacterium]|nr:hypothetical protein [Gemmataceae bacterium]
MAYKLARLLSLFALGAIVLGLSGGGEVSKATPPVEAPASERAVFLGGEMSEEDLIAFTANVAASGQRGIVLLDAPRSSKHMRAFLSAYQPDRVIPVGTFPDGIADLEKRLDVRTAPAIAWDHDKPTALWKALFSRAERVVVCPAEPRRLLLQAACLAGVLQAPLHVTRGDGEEFAALRRQVVEWKTQEVYLLGTYQLPKNLPNVRIIRLANEEAVHASYLRHQLAKGPIQSFVVANPTDARKGMGVMSCLAPWVALQRRGTLLLTNDEGDNTPSLVAAESKHPRLHSVDNLLLVADLRSIPMERRPNPVAGKDSHIEMEPLTPTGNAPFSFATGRLFHAQPAVVTLMLARQRLLESAPKTAKRKALVVSNPSGGLPLLETFSRNTARELKNCGYETTAIFGHDVTKDDVRRLLPQSDLFLWEGHHSTLIKDYGFAEWNEPLPPSFVFLQSCLALAETKAGPLLERGAVGVVGSSTRIYSASGGAFALAFFNAMLYEGQPVGSALRQAKNFLLAYSLLKEKRLGKNAKLGGANLRSAWAFTLWGDPTLKLPETTTTESLAGVKHEVKGHVITVQLPDTIYERVTNGDFHAQMRPNARLAGLLRSDEDSGRHLVPFVFAEVHLPKAPAGQAPRLRSKLPDANWVFSWDERRRCGYLLVTPRPRDQRELRFHIDYEAQVIVPEPETAAGTGQ